MSRNPLRRLACRIGIHEPRRVGQTRIVEGNYSCSGAWAHWSTYEQRLIRCAVCGKENWQTFDTTNHNSNITSDARRVRDAIDEREAQADA